MSGLSNETISVLLWIAGGFAAMVALVVVAGSTIHRGMRYDWDDDETAGN